MLVLALTKHAYSVTNGMLEAVEKRTPSGNAVVQLLCPIAALLAKAV